MITRSEIQRTMRLAQSIRKNPSLFINQLQDMAELLLHINDNMISECGESVETWLCPVTQQMAGPSADHIVNDPMANYPTNEV